LNEPRDWSFEPAGSLRVVTDQATDFWRETHYGFRRDNGHAYLAAAPGAFTAQLRFRGRFEALYDQAGLMIRVDSQHWLKAGLEFNDGRPMMGSVLTVERSDWATGLFAGDPGDFWMRATVSAGVLRLQYSADGRVWPMLRLAPFPAAERYLVGPMCCTPERGGLEVLFSDFTVTPPTDKALHDLS